MKTSAHPAAEWFRRDLEAVEADVLKVIQKHGAKGTQILAHALIEVAGSVLSAIVEAEPAAGPDIDLKLSELQVFIATTTTKLAQ